MKTLILSNIRKKLILSAILTASLGLTSCSDWLEMEAYTSDDIETTFSAVSYTHLTLPTKLEV